MSALSSVANQVMWNRLISVVEEQARALVRTAFSTSVREAGDLSAGVYDLAGRMLAQAVTGTPGHVNAMAESVAHFMREIGVAEMREGDVYITNDPWMGTGHLHDITVVTPSFFKGRHVGYFACTAHVVDIGGRGFGADGNSVYEEGFLIPIMHFAREGEVNRDLVKIVRNNVREADQVVGDIYALAACNETGHRRLADMLEEFGLEDLETIAGFILEHSRRATVERIAALRKESSSQITLNEMTIDGYDTPIRLAVRLDICQDRILTDFTGTSAVDPKGINVPLVYTKAYACYGLKCAIAPEIPNNAASLAPFEVTAPEGCILNAVHPAPVALRHVIGHMIPDTVLGALHKVLPGVVPAEGCGSLCNFQLSLRPRRDGNVPPDARRAEVLLFNCGGSGARPSFDGMNATAFPSGVMTMPVEATEHTGPVIVWRKELRPDSGGAGRQRGGLGQYMEIGATEGHEFDFSAMFDRVRHPARGREGGQPGGLTRFDLDDGTVMRGKGRQAIPPGRRVMLALPGGAGYGDPKDRDPALVRRDVERGYISPESALRDYGISPENKAREPGMSVGPMTGVPKHSAYDVVIVGGAIMGSSVAWFLSADPVFQGRILVVERDPNYAQAASALSASCIRHQFSNAVNVRMSMFGTEFIRSFREQLGGDPETPEIVLKETGYMFLASEVGVPVLRENQAVQAGCGAATVLMTPDEIAARFPFYNIDGIALGSFNPVGEGWFDGFTMMQWWRRKARENGVEYITGEVVAMTRNGGRVDSVTLASGETVACGTVVNAAGPYGGRVAAMAGIELPVEPRKRCLFVFDCRTPLGQPMPLTVDPSGVHCRSEGEFYLAGAVPEDDSRPDHDDFEVDYSEFEDKVWPVMANRVPAFEAIKLVRGWVGHYDFNALDQNGVIGPHPEIGNFLFANGFSGHGLQHAAAVGRAVGELVSHGEYRTLDLSELAYDRVLTGTAFREQAII